MEKLIKTGCIFFVTVLVGFIVYSNADLFAEKTDEKPQPGATATATDERKAQHAIYGELEQRLKKLREEHR